MTAREARCLIAADRETRLVPMPVDLTDETQFPEMALARLHLASLSPERRAELNKEWEA